jgi:peptide/nickel transport system substrate-binding protein
LDPAYAKDQANIWICNQVYNGLLQLDDQLNIQPCIAKEWKIDSSGLIYTFDLRQDVFFHDHEAFHGGKGRKVTAQDFVYSFNRILDPKIASPGRWVFNKVDTAGGGFLAVNDSTLQITLSECFPPFAGILTMIYCSVVPHEAAELFGSDFRRNPVGTGPFRLNIWKENIKLVLTKNKKYFEVKNDDQLPYLDAVAVTFLKDKQLAFLEFVKGNLDFISGLDHSYKDELLTREGKLRGKYQDKFILLTVPYLNTEYVAMLVDTSLEVVKNSPLKHKNIRKAINYGFDRQRMIKYLRNNIGFPGNQGIIPPGLQAFDSSWTAYDYDPVKARQLIKEAGYQDGFQVPELKLHTTADYVDIFKYIQHQLEEIGIRLSIEVNPAATLMQMKTNGRINLFRASWIADYPDAENYLALFYSLNKAPAGPNYSRFNNLEYDSLYEISQTNISEELRKEVYRKMDQIVMDNAPVIILYYDQALRFTQKNIQNLGINPLNLLVLKKVKKTLAN